jgi:uncharacterized protein (TIGR04255 family)
LAVANSTPPLPNFKRPPIVEVSLDLQFEPLARLRAPLLGLFWGEVRDQFPNHFTVEEQVLLRPLAAEAFDGPNLIEPQIEVTVIETPPASRFWFVSGDGSELLQVQQDRLIVNWRRPEQDGSYPRYDHVRQLFTTYFAALSAFIEREHLGVIRPNQCAVTYYNHIEAGRGWADHGDAAAIFTPLAGRPQRSALPKAEDAKVALRYVMNDENGVPRGRLYADFQPAFRKADKLAMYILTLTSRVEIHSVGLDAILNCFDLGHEWAARAFVDLTTPEMQQIWKAER